MFCDDRQHACYKALLRVLLYGIGMPQSPSLMKVGCQSMVLALMQMSSQLNCVNSCWRWMLLHFLAMLTSSRRCWSPVWCL